MATLLVFLGAIVFVISLTNQASEGMILSSIMIVSAIPAYLLGRVCLYVLAGR
jgi:hypothetical protein